MNVHVIFRPGTQLHGLIFVLKHISFLICNLDPYEVKDSTHTHTHTHTKEKNQGGQTVRVYLNHPSLVHTSQNLSRLTATMILICSGLLLLALSGENITNLQPFKETSFTFMSSNGALIYTLSNHSAYFIIYLLL